MAAGPWLAAGSTAQSLAGYFGQREANRANRDLMSAQHGFNLQNWALEKNWQRLAWNKQNEYDQFLWHQQNKYNSPEQQMARLKAAGLNPHLAFGKGVQGDTGNSAQIRPNSPGSSGAPESVTLPQMRNELAGFNAFSNIYDLKIKKAQESNIESQTNINELKAIGQGINNLNELVKNRQWKLNLERGKFDLGERKSKLPFELKGLEYSNQATLQKIQESIANMQLTQEGIKDKQTFRPLQESIMKQSVKKMETEMKYFDARIKNLSLQDKKLMAEKLLINAQEIGQLYENEMREAGASFKDNTILRNFQKNVKDWHDKYWFLTKYIKFGL